ncbi:MAG: hypothetical protein PF488_00400 [Patescibacteria group bacterium]|jgi:hypothetical protein|nr:hypothetical protein [Patescibacteria group bacterium]
MNKKMKKFFGSKQFTSRILPIILIIILAAIAYLSFASSDETIDENEAKIKSERFVNDFLIENGKATVKSVEKEYGLYKLKIDTGSGELVDSYITKDGKFFFPQALNIKEIYGGEENGAPAGQQQEAVTEVSVKSDKPQVELFVMSHCPFGTQMEKAAIPAVETLSDSIDFDIKFNSYAMHGEKELNEEMLQYCLMEEQEDVYMDYLNCFLTDSDSERCLAEINVTKDSLDSCITQIDEEYSITSDYENKVNYQGSYPGFGIHTADNQKYGVAGSPTLVINGQTVKANRTPAAVLDVICSAFTTQPEACKANISTASPAAGFGTETTSASASEAACN